MREARIWIFGLNDFVAPDDKVLIGLIEGNIVIIPMNQSNDSYPNLKTLVRTSKLDKKSKKRLKNRKREKEYKAFKKDYLKQAMENTKLGLEGELFVFFFERQRLIKAEREDLAEKVEHTSVVKGDGLGYDILSYDINGTKKFIEVKTTAGRCNSRLFLSINEIEFSCKNPNNFFLFRIYKFNNVRKSGKIKSLKGCLSDNIHIEPTSFSAVVEE
ncbi:DUF3883 domain-containing protein [Maribacter algicola]|uniref:DUF3883 domain-containing protein n=1 Tax=Meishania litoralis TaxID=3434685 RepID=A0ACC7LQQ1_9FLAO